MSASATGANTTTSSAPFWHGFRTTTKDAEFDEINAVARDLADLIRRIDPEAMVADRFWSTFVDDVEMGDFATQADEQ